MAPLIGITTRTVFLERQMHRERSQAIAESVAASVAHAGGVPVLLPSNVDPETGMAAARHMDGLILSGGPDVDPLHFDEEPLPGLGDVDGVRDALEIALCRYTLDEDVPLLGVCRGVQVMAAAVGGTVIQHLEPEGVNHDVRGFQDGPGHSVDLAAGTRLREIVGAARIRVNSSHHQAVGRMPEGMVVSARATDGVIEAIEHAGKRFWVGVQWHPHWTYETEPAQAAILAAFVGACRP